MRRPFGVLEAERRRDMAIKEVAQGTFWLREKRTSFVVNTTTNELTCHKECEVRNTTSPPECEKCCGKSSQDLKKFGSSLDLPDALSKFIARVQVEDASGDSEWVPVCEGGWCACKRVTSGLPGETIEEKLQRVLRERTQVAEVVKAKPGRAVAEAARAKVGKVVAPVAKAKRGKAAAAAARASTPQKKKSRRSSTT
jgi:hypothetical protein